MKNDGFLQNEEYILSLGRYKNCIKSIEKNLLYFVRHEKYAAPSKKIDTFANHWILAFSPNTNEEILIRNGSKYLTIEKNTAIFIPPFCIIEWNIKNASEFRWDAFISPVELPKKIKSNPIVFKYDSAAKPQSINEIFNLVNKQLNSSNFIEIEQQKEKSILAVRVKEALEKNFTKEISISTLAKKMNVSRMSFSSSFKKSYGLTPIDYRHRLRIFEALRLINQGRSVNQAMIESGFLVPSQFIYHFKKNLGTTPSKFSPNQLKKKS